MAVDKKEEQEEELIPVGEGAEEGEDSSQLPDADAEDQDDDEDEDDDEEERLGASEDDGDDVKEKRRKERKTRKERQKAARERDQREMMFLQSRNEELERRFSQVEQRVGYSEVSAVDQRINKIKTDLKLADQVISKAITAQDGERYTEAQRIRDGLRDDLGRMEYAKQQVVQRISKPATPEVDPRLVSHAAAWMEDHSWWDPNGGDNDSRTVSRLDQAMVNEGFDPTTPEYWDELSRRVEEALPKRYAQGNGKAEPKKKSTGPRFSTGGRERPLKKGEVYISADRKAAMVEAGVWDDPELRQKYLKSYSKYDSENRA
jgi:hypothetical protein